MVERPNNVRPARTADRTSNSRRHRAEMRTDEPQSAYRSYAGGDRQTDQRSSRVGRHHGEHGTQW